MKVTRGLSLVQAFCLLWLLGCSKNEPTPQSTAQTPLRVEQSGTTEQSAPIELTESANMRTEETKPSAPVEKVASVTAPPAQPPQQYQPRQSLAPGQLPASASLTQQQGKSFVTQRAVNWCIPCSIENCLRYVGITDVTQEKIIVAFCRMYGGKSLGAWARSSQPVSVRDLTDEQIIAAAKPDFFTNGNFSTFARAAAAVADLRKRGFEFELIPPTNQAQFMEKLKRAIVNDCPVLMAFLVDRRVYHIVMILGYEERGVLAFNPASGKTGLIRFSKFSPKHDGLVLRPIQKEKRGT